VNRRGYIAVPPNRKVTANFAEYLEGFVEPYSYRNVHSGCHADRGRSSSSAFEPLRELASSGGSAIRQAD